jgi:hypothetical protein
MPERSERADSHNDVKKITINENNAHNADALRIDFQKEEFERKIEQKDFKYDPPIELIKEITNDFLNRLRYVTGASIIKPLEFPHVSWNIRYLNDDGSELQEQEGYYRCTFGRKFQYSFIAVNKEVWDSVHSIAPFQPLPVWKNLLLDAEGMLPEVGPAIILTFTALEVFISKILDELVSTGKIDNKLWEWINNRGPLKDPSIEEKYDSLSRYLIGKSIKENNDIWEAFKHLRKARNSFAHDGISKVGDTEVTPGKAREFIVKAKEIINYIKNEIPKELHWPEFKHEIRITFAQQLMKSEDESS